MYTGRVTVAERTHRYRAGMRAQGLRPVQLWVPDVRTSDFAREAARQATLAATADRHGDDQDFVDAISVLWQE